MSSADARCEAAVLAAGHGTRIGASAQAPKPLVRVLGRLLIDLVLQALADAGVQRVAVAVRAEHPALAAYLREARHPVSVVAVARDTVGGKDSLLGLRPHLADTFVLCTADGLFAAGELRTFLANAQQSRAVLALGVVPRQVGSNADVGVILCDRRVVALGKHLHGTEWVAEGPMWCSREVFDRRALQATRQITSLSAFHGQLVELGYRVEAQPFSWAFDIDDQSDLRRAEARLRELTT